jgi:hypothetical protein
MKGERYAKGLEPDFVKFVGEELPFLSFEEACLWYGTVVPVLSDQHLAFLGCNDRYFLLTCILRRADAVNEWCYDRCREVEEDPDEHLDLWARYHYKSTIITFAGSIQEIITDPEVTIAIFGNTFDIAQPFLEQIATELETNDILKRVYADVLWQNPRREAQTWSKIHGIVVKRQDNPKELTVQAFGIMEGLPTGGHWKLRIYNDIVTFKSVTATDTDQIGKTTTQWELSQSLGTHDGGGRRWHEGTRYSYADAYGVMMERKSLKPRIYPATHDGTMNGRPVFLTEDAWAKIKNDQRKVVTAQFLLNPTAGQENTFFVEWLRSYAMRPAVLNVYIIGDPAGKPSATSDRTAICVIGIDSNLNRYLLDGFCHKMRMSERWDALSSLYRKWRYAPGVRMTRVAWERYGLQSDMEYFEEKTFQKKIEGLTIDEVSWTREGPQSKNARISRLEPYFKASQFWMPPKVWYEGKVCTWSIKVDEEPIIVDGEPVRDKKTGSIITQAVPGSAKIIYQPVKSLTKAEADAKRRGDLYRIMEPIVRLDQDGNRYDLTRVFFEEFRLHPFAPHDDLIDAVSRIQDVDPNPPSVYEEMAQREAQRAPYPDT